MLYVPYVDALCAKAASRLYFLKILKHSGLQVQCSDLLGFYKSVICSVIKYGMHGTTSQSDHCTEWSTEDSPKVGLTHPITLQYNIALAYYEIESLKLRRNNFQKSSLNRFVILRTASMICSHLNLILLFSLIAVSHSLSYSPGQNKSVLLVH